MNMNDNDYNVSLLSDFTIENFWKKTSTKGKSVKELKEEYQKFVENNEQSVNESVNAFVDKHTQLILESAADMRRKREQQQKKEVSGEERKTKVVTSEESLLDDDDVTYKTMDDIERHNTSNKIIRKRVVYDEAEDYLSHETITVSNYKNGFRNQDVHDIHYLTDLMYSMILSGEYEWENNDEALPASLYNTHSVREFDAVFAFKDLPNIDLSQWDVTNGTNFDGMFYKSTFNNDSIKSWELLKADNIRNMFVGSDMDKKDAIDAWEGTIKTGYLPVLGKVSPDDAEKAKRKASLMAGSKKDLQRKLTTKKQQSMSDMMEPIASSRQYVMSSEDFINEKFGDFTKKVIGKVAKAVKEFTIKLKNGFQYVLDKTMFCFMANAPENIVAFVHDGGKAGTYAETGKTVSYPSKSGYYDEIKEGDDEYNKYLKFLEYLKSSSIKESVEIDERRVGLKAVDHEQGNTYVNIGARDVSSAGLKDEINLAIMDIRENGKSTRKPLCVWGAPGIGKTSIPKIMIDEINEEITKSGKGNDNKMSVIVKDCSMLQAGDLNMPMPVKSVNLKEAIKNNPATAKLAKELGMSDEDLESLVEEKSSDAPKTWLPVYQPTGDPKKDAVLNARANGATNPIYDKEHNIIGFENNGGGGILMFDEFLKGDLDTLFGIAQLMIERSLSGYVLGDKWFCMACSNRPADDTRTANAWADAPDSLKSRLGHINFVPTFSDWAKWAKEKGGFDDFTIDFINTGDVNGPNSRWHNIDPTETNVNYETRMITPRNWSYCISELNNVCKLLKVNTYDELGKERFLRIVNKYLPEKISELYVTEYMANGGGNEYAYSYNKVVNGEVTKVGENANPKKVISNWMQYVQKNYGMDEGERIPIEDLEKLANFFETNFGDKSGNILALFIAKVYKYCDMFSDSKNDKFWDDFSEKHKEYDMDTLYDTVQ